MRIFLFLLCLAGLFSGCGYAGALLRPRAGHEKTPVSAIRARFASRKMIALVFEGGAGKGGRREYAFQFDKSASIDKALINRKIPVAERSLVQSVLEAHGLPDSGSFRQEDLERIAKQSQAEVLILGVAFSAPRPTMLNSEKQERSAILRAVDLRTFEVINSVQSDGVAGPDVWRDLVPQLLLLDEVD